MSFKHFDFELISVTDTCCIEVLIKARSFSFWNKSRQLTPVYRGNSWFSLGAHPTKKTSPLTAHPDA